MKTTPQFRLSRLNIFLFDFRQARRLVRYILRRKLHGVKNPQAVSKLIHISFNTSLVVAYSRPFHKSNDGVNVRVSLSDTVDVILETPVEQALHRKVIDMRDQAFAHSDAAAHEIEGFNYDGATVQLYKIAFEPLTREETLLLSRMIEKWVTYLEKQRSELKKAKAHAEKTRYRI